MIDRKAVLSLAGALLALSSVSSARTIDAMNMKLDAVTKSIADGDYASAGESLDALYAGVAYEGSEAVAVAADVKQDPNPPTIFYPDGKPAETGKLRKASLGGIDAPVAMGQTQEGVIKVGAAGAVGGAVVGEIVNRAVREAEKAAERYVERDQTNESKEKYGGCRMKGTCSK